MDVRGVHFADTAGPAGPAGDAPDPRPHGQPGIRLLVAVAASVIVIAAIATLIALRGHPPMTRATSNGTNQPIQNAANSTSTTARDTLHAGPRYLGRVGAASTFLGVEFAPPGQVVPTITWRQAYATCTSTEPRTDPGCDNTSGPNITLALVTTPGSGHTGSDGSIIPLLNNTLAYVLSWPHEQCVPTGGVHAPGATPPPVEPVPCTMIVIIDAHTGRPAYLASGTV